MIDKILNQEITEYNFDTMESMDNNFSMYYFLQKFDLEKHVTHWDGTYIELCNKIGCHSGGRGDCYSHKIRFEEI